MSILNQAIANLDTFFVLTSNRDPLKLDTVRRPAEDFLSAGSSIPFASTLAGQKPWTGVSSADDVRTAGLKFAVTPYEGSLELHEELLARPYDSPDAGKTGSTQGIYKPKEGTHYTTKNDLLINEVDGKLHVIQNFDVTSTNASNNTSIVSFLLNGVSSLEWTRSVPFLEISVTTSKGTNMIATSDFLNSSDIGTNVRSEDELEEQAKDGSLRFTTAGMEAFTMPQTLVNIDKERTDIRQDPFRPLASVIDFKTSLNGFISTGTGGNTGMILKDKKASLRLICHNQSYLPLLAPIVKPDQRGETLINIEYGWTHPDGQRLGRASDAQTNNDVGVIIDSCTISEMYSILDCRVTFNDSGEANIDLDLSYSSVNAGLTTAKVGSAGDTTTGVEVTQQINGMLDLFAMNNAGREGADFSVRGFMNRLQEDEVLNKEASSDLRNYRKAVIRDLKDKKFGNTVTSVDKVNLSTTGLQHLKELFLKFFGESNSDAFLRAAAQSNPNSTVDGLLSNLQKLPDPYLRLPSEHNGQKKRCGLNDGQMKKAAKSKPTVPQFISLGKIIASIAGPALANLPGYEEVQLVFHPFNPSSGAAHTYNIAQFPIKYSEFKKFLKEMVKIGGHISVNEFINQLFQKFVHVGGNADVFGIKGMKKLVDIDKALYKAYDIQAATGLNLEESSISPEFVPPKVAMFCEAGPGRSNLNATKYAGIKNRAVLRVNFVDTEFVTSRVFQGALNAAQTTGVFPKVIRAHSDAITSVSHHEISMRAGYILQNNGYLEVFQNTSNTDGADEQELTPTDRIVDKVWDAFSSSPNQNQKGKSTLTKDKVKSAVEAMTSEYNFLTSKATGNRQAFIESMKAVSEKEFTGYIKLGTDGSAVTSATVQTTQDPRIITLSLLDRRTPEEKEQDKRSGRKLLTMSVLPVEVDLTVLGCPFVYPGQEYFVDLNTNTNLDQFYRVISVEHSITSGKFETSMKLVPGQAGPKYQGTKGTITNFIVSRIRSLSL